MNSYNECLLGVGPRDQLGWVLVRSSPMRPASRALVMPQVLNYLLLLCLEVVSFLISTLEPLLLPLQEPLVGSFP